MLHFLPAPLLGTVMALLLCANTLFWMVPVYAATLLKLLSPRGRIRDRVSEWVAWGAQTWASVNVLLADHLLRIRWDIRGVEKLNRRGQYLVCSNHQSWNDIFSLMRAFDRRAPFFKFFIKQELIWVPVLGLAWWGLDYPFMKRYSAAKLEKHPELRGKDLETTRKACEHYRNVPVTILNFLEGTRFTQAKHDRQQSPYRHLLRPKAGGMALSLSALGEKINSLLDVTIVYPEGAKGFWDFLAGRVQQVVVEVRSLTIPHELYAGSYEDDPAFRKRFQDWIAQLWAEKDRRIDELLAEAGAA
ncbi:MAG TPA: acyltransferase [Nevskia sp.]|jgi:1-acyl-sn-glycerol-3-phosphate acyltransferase|nr:acyltransferase [Nevskia sp.]